MLPESLKRHLPSTLSLGLLAGALVSLPATALAGNAGSIGGYTVEDNAWVGRTRGEISMYGYYGSPIHLGLAGRFFMELAPALSLEAGAALPLYLFGAEDGFLWANAGLSLHFNRVTHEVVGEELYSTTDETTGITHSQYVEIPMGVRRSKGLHFGGLLVRTPDYNESGGGEEAWDVTELGGYGGYDWWMIINRQAWVDGYGYVGGAQQRHAWVDLLYAARRTAKEAEAEIDEQAFGLRTGFTLGFGMPWGANVGFELNVWPGSDWSGVISVGLSWLERRNVPGR